MISTHATLDGPTYLSPEDLDWQKKGPANTFLLWNARIQTPLCWELYLNERNTNWDHINPKYDTAIQHPRTDTEKVALFKSFQDQPVEQKLFASGTISRLLSPVIEISLPNAPNNYVSLHVSFCNWCHPVWVTWDSMNDEWTHESRDLEEMFMRLWEQSPESIKWQKSIFDWVKKNWADKIIESNIYP
ncbi:MAG: hypothetical protein AAF902_19405 [Chloroflexota bacterium]